MTKYTWSGFSKKTISNRIELLKNLNLLTSENQNKLSNQENLPLEIADQMVENVITELSLPFAIAPNFLIDGKIYHLPMVTEEPSVVAAASYAAGLIKRSNGFKTSVHNRLMIGEIVLYDINDMLKASCSILEQKENLLAIANEAHPSIVKRGGGARHLWTDIKDNFLIVFVSIDTKEAMGANIVNTMMEALAPTVKIISKGKVLTAILSNYATESLVSAECTLDIKVLSRQKNEAKELAQKLEKISQLAQIDPYRASTHNKGIFNGIDALIIATGNDWRAIEAGAHAFASRTGQYRGLSQWFFHSDTNQIHGKLTLPMPVASKGGSIGLNPSVQIARDILENPTAKQLARLVVSLGLAQNFAALKALTSTGIQAGHMKLQAKSLALLAGAKHHEVAILVKHLLSEKHLNLDTAKQLLNQLRQKN